jgi:hypothetical protein
MADVAVVLDTAGLTGLQAGKKGQKKAGGGAVQADFVLALISQISAGDVAKGQSLKLASGAADIDASGAGRSVRADQLIAASQQGEKAPAVAFSDEAVTADGAEGGHVAGGRHVRVYGIGVAHPPTAGGRGAYARHAIYFPLRAGCQATIVTLHPPRGGCPSRFGQALKGSVGIIGRSIGYP